MSIRSELKAKLQKVKGEQTEQERNLEVEAKKMIEEFIIPKFREIADKQTTSFLWIDFHLNIGCWCYSSNIDHWSERKASPYDSSVVSKAIHLAKDFEIETKESDDDAGGTIYSFVLDL